MAPAQFVPVLDVDLDLAGTLSGADLELARREAIAPAMRIPRGPWSRAELSGLGAGNLGALVVEGLLMRSLTVAGRTTTELLGVGDLLRPGDLEVGFPPVSSRTAWTVLAPVTLALLDRGFTQVVGRYPELLEAITRRTVGRSRALSLQLALGQVPRVDGRLLLLLWMLADRWGRVSADGVLLPLRLTHETLSELVAARRPSVTTALRHLTELGLVERRADGWLLSRTADAHLHELLRVPADAVA